MPISPEVPRTARKVSLGFLLKTLDQEWATFAASEARTPYPERWEVDLMTYYHVALRVGLHWLSGDPYTYKFPREFQTHRLAKVCAYLQRSEKLAPLALELERDRQVTLLREVAWPPYAEVCTGMTHLGEGGTVAEFSTPGFTWSGIDTLWSEREPEGPQNTPPSYLPQFHSPESEAFHCNSIAVLYLNRATKRPLLDLDVTPF